jgi:arylsulfatase A-like enzyme
MTPRVLLSLAGAVVVLGGCRGTPEAPSTSRASLARLPDRPMTLAVTDIAPGETAGFRIVGGLDSTDVTFVRGTVGLQTCPAPLNGACIDLGSPKKLGTATTDANGTVLFELTMPATIPVGGSFGIQALTTDAGGVTYVSNVVERTILAAAAYAPPPATNVLVILVDDVGVDRFSLYGASHPAVTPVIDGLAADGVLFENAWAMPWCAPTRASLQTGRYPRRTGYGVNPPITSGDVELDPNLVTIADLVEHSPYATYETSYVGKWHLSAYESESGTLGPTVQGWDWWSGAMENLGTWDGPNPPDPGFWNWQKVDTAGVVTVETAYATTDNVDDALDRLAVMNEPWMMQVSFNAPHSPYHVPPAGLYTNLALTESSPVPDKHRAMLEAVDVEIGRLLAGVSVDVLDRTTILFVGDNGTPKLALKDEDPDWTEAKGTLTDGGVRVPLIVSGPLVGTPGATSTTLASVVDIFPTIAEIAGVDTSVLRGSLDPEAPLALDGFSLVPALADPAAPTGRTSLYAEIFSPGGGGPFDEDSRAIRNATHKLIVDALCGDERFYEYVAGAEDEGNNLLGHVLTPEQEASLDALRTEMTSLVDGMTYDATTWPDSLASGACPGDTGDTGAAP